MVAPITGPFTKTNTSPDGKRFTRQISYRQAKPFDQPLPYQALFVEGWDRSVTSTIWGFYDSNQVGNLSWSTENNTDYFNRRRSAAYNAAYEQLKGKIGDSAGWAENIAQFRSAADMINDRAVQLARFFVNLRKGKFSEAARGLKSPRPRNLRDGDKAFAGNVLEWSYGWSPLLSDISSSVSILTDTEFVTRKLRATSSESWTQPVNYKEAYSNGTSWTRLLTVAEVKARISCQARIDNPNLYLAGAMGLIDPALPWKLVPFSFVVDWFVNVEQVISSITGFLGVQLEHPFHSFRTRSTFDRRVTANWSEYNPWDGSTFSAYSISTSYRKEEKFDRILGIPSPNLIVKPFRGFSLQRGLEAISLIIAVFK